MAIDWEAYRKKAKKRDGYEYQKNIMNNDIAPVRTTTTLSGDDIAPVTTTKKSLFDDGYDFGDITKTILNSRKTNAQETNNIGPVTSQEDKYSKLTLKEIDDEISRLQGEKKAYAEKYGNKVTLMASSAAEKILGGLTNALGIGNDVDLSDLKTGVDKLNDYQAEIETLQTYQLKKAIEEKYKVLDEETLSEVEALSGFIGEGQIKGIFDLVGIESGGETEEEKSARKSLKKKGYSDDEIAELVELHNRQKQSGINREYEKVMEDFGSKHPVAQIGQSAFTDIFGSFGGTLSEAQQYIKKLQGEGSKYGINTDDIYHGITRGNIAADTKAKADHNWKIETPTGQELDAFDIAFDIGSGVADNVARMVVGGGNSSISGAMMGSQVFNQSVIEGKEKGYSDEKALTIGLLQASIESLTEKYSVETILGDSGGIARKLAKSFVAEGSEGVTSDWLNRILDVIANGNHSETMKSYNSYIEDGYSENDALVQMIYEIGGESLKTFLLEGTTGFILGGGVSLVNIAQQKTSTQSEKNTVNKLVEEEIAEITKNRAIEKSVNEEIARREKEQGGKLTEENIEALRKSHTAKIESGEIELSSEELSKKDIADIKKRIKDSLKDGKIELSKIEDILTPDAIKEINELKETLNNTKDEQKKAEIGDKIRQLENTRTENLKNQARDNKYLRKAVYEKIASETRYEDDSEITDENEKALVESAKRYANNTTETRKYVGVLRNMVKDGKRIVLTNNQELLEQGDLVAKKGITSEIQAEIKSLENQLSETTDKKEKAKIQEQIIALKYLDVGGMVKVDKNGVETIIINMDSNQAKYTVLGHEAKHTLEKYGLNKDFNKILFEYAKTKGDLDAVRERIESLYKNQNDVDIDGEVAADLTGKYLFEDEKFLDALMKNKSDFKVRQAIEKIKEIIDDFVIRFKGTEQEKQLREVQKKFTELYNSTEADIGENTAQKNTVESEKTLYSLNDNLENVGKILYDNNNPLAIVNRAKSNNNSSINWVYKSEIFSVTENKQFHEKISEINQGSQAFEKNSRGEYMLPIGNKIIFTDGNYESPYIREIIEVLTDNATEYEVVKETIFGVENGKLEKSEEVQVLKALFGDGFVISYKSEVNGVYEWENGNSKGKTRRTVVRNYLNKQYRTGNDKQSQGTPINEIEPIKKTSSKDGVFSIGEKKQYSLSDSDNSSKDVFGFTVKQDAKVNEDLLEELSIWHPDAQVDSDGNVTVYHRTSKENADKIRKTGVMTALEDALFFSSKSDGYASDYGDTVVAFKIPSTVLRVNDIFDGEVHFDIPLKRINNQWSLNVSKYLVDENTTDTQYSLSEETDYSRVLEMQKEVNQLTNSIKEIENSDEFKLQINNLSNAIDNGDVDNGVKAYKQWEEESGYRAIKEKRDAMREELDNFNKRMQYDYSRKALEEEKNAIDKSGLSEADYFRKQAVKEFGYTPYFYDAGYITPNGKMLNFSGEKGKHFGSRGNDHRGISIIYANTQGTEALNRFIKDGNIRIMAESPGIDISTAAEPTKEQYATIRRFIYEYIDKEYFNIDFTDENGNVIGSLEYENRINPTRILNDIKHFYATGEIRGQNDIEKYRYSLSKEGETVDYNKSLRSMRYNDDLPIRDDIQKKSNIILDDDTPIRSDLAPMTEDEANAMRNDVPLTDADVPPEIDAPMYDGSDTKIDDTTLKGISQRLRETLSLNAKETKAIQDVVQKYSTTGIPDKTKIFDDIKEQFGEKVWRERNEEVSEIKRALKGFKIKVSDEIKSDIPDYSDWKKRHQGRLNFSQDGLTVDEIYMGLSISYPSLFPDDIINPTDQLLRMAELVENDIYHTASQEVDNDIIQEATEIIYDEVSKYKENELSQKAVEEQGNFYRGLVEEAEGSTAKTVKERIADELKNARTELLMNQQLRDESQVDFEKEISRLQAVYNGKRDKNTKTANNLLRRIERLQRMKNDVDAEYSKRISDIENRLAKIESKDYATVEQRKIKQQELQSQMENLVGDTSTWVDKKLGISYKVNTLRRNLRDIVRNADGKRDVAKADAIYDELQGKYNHNEAELNRESNRIKQQFAKMKITKAEDAYIQMLGELRHNPETTLTEDVVNDFYNKHKKNIDEAKVDKAIEMARPLYDELLSRVNQVLSEQGMKKIPYRKGYFPHFTEDKQGVLGKLFNWKTKNNDIPTDIAGLTEEFNPNRSWQSFNKQRKSDVTDYSFLKGLDTYVQGALDWIYHIEDIQKRRALENHIRYVHSENGIKERIDAIRNNEEYDANEMQDQIDIVYKEAGNPLNNFVTDFRAQTNTLAGKKSSLDRGMEEMTNRKFYSTMTNLSNRVSANMVAGSISSALTNFIPITQSWGQVSPVSSLRAMGDTIVSTFRDDGTINKSDFLTNRLRKSENLYKDFWDKSGEVFGILMESIDSFTSQTVWRSKYLENIANGMSENEAIKNADQFAENVLAGRSRGNNPTIFDSKNPLAKTLTVFQLEVNNQYGYMFKDMPQDLANESKAKLVKGYVTMFLGAYAYNALYSSLVGRDSAFDPIGIIEDLLRDLGVIGGDDDEDEEEIAPTDVITGLAENIAEELPFVGGLLGGGRIPLSSAFPYGGIKEAFDGTLEDMSEGNIKSLTKEWLNPVWYLAMPMGGGQIKKTWQGVKMFDDDLPIAGSYTDSGNLRFPVEDTTLNRVQTALFGQYANKNARKYFDDDIAPLNEKQIKEYTDLDLPISDYWKYREKLKDFKTQDEKVAYINGLDVTEEQKNTLKSYLYNEEGYRADNPEKYAFLESEGIGFLGYKEADEETQNAWSWAFKNQDKYRYLKENGVNPEDYSVYYSPRVEFDDEGDKAYDWAFNNPEKATVGKVFSSGVKEYRQYTRDLNNLEADKDGNGKSISGSKKKKVVAYINSLDIDDGAKYVLWKSQYPADKTYNKAIFEYINGRSDITRDEKITILEELGAKVDSNGNVRW